MLILALAATASASWKEIKPGAPTICSTGEPFSFFYQKRTINKLVVEFQGGGACCEFLCRCYIHVLIFIV